MQLLTEHGMSVFIKINILQKISDCQMVRILVAAGLDNFITKHCPLLLCIELQSC